REIIRKLNSNKSTIHQRNEIIENSFSIEFSHETKLIQEENLEEKREMVRSALKKLSSKQRQAILLFYEEGMSYKEISIAMEFSEVKSARKIVYRALSSLKGILIGKYN